jgi:endonuclease-3 related protein
MYNELSFIYEALLSHYGDPHWWPARTTYEVIVGAILTQNTAWGNVEKAISNFGDNLTPEFVSKTDISELTKIIRSAGFFNQKAVYLKEITAWYSRYGYEVTNVRHEPLAKIRRELLATKGVGQETADSILLYAFGYPAFVVDAYTVRLCGRYPIDAGKGYSSVKAHFENNLPANVGIYNNYHALIVINAKEHCRKKMQCEGCPLNDGCKRTSSD